MFTQRRWRETLDLFNCIKEFSLQADALSWDFVVAACEDSWIQLDPACSANWTVFFCFIHGTIWSLDWLLAIDANIRRSLWCFTIWWVHISWDFNIPLKQMSTSRSNGGHRFPKISITTSGTKIPRAHMFLNRAWNGTTKCTLWIEYTEECGQWMQAIALLLKFRELSDLQFLRPFDTGYSDRLGRFSIYQHVCCKSDGWFWRCMYLYLIGMMMLHGPWPIFLVGLNHLHLLRFQTVVIFRW